MAGKENIIEDFYGFIKYLLPIINKFPKEQEFIWSEFINFYFLQIHELYIEAYYGQKQLKRRIFKKPAGSGLYADIEVFAEHPNKLGC